MTEYQEAVALAIRVLEKPFIDPDGDIVMLARQFMRRANWEPIETHDPNETRSCLIWCPDNKCQYTAIYREGGWLYFGGNGRGKVSDHSGPPSHWMPLPEPPVML